MSENVQILVVDDEPQMLRAIARMLRSAGYGVTEASTGNEGLRLAKENAPDLILLDVVLPDVNGIEVCRRIKADAVLAESYVVLMSGLQTVSESQAEGLEGGADGYIVRPISNRELLARVEALLRLKRAERALRKSQADLARAQSIAHIGNWEWDVRTGEVLWSDEVYRVFGLESQEPSYELAGSLVHPDDKEFWERSVRAALYDGEPFRIDYRAVRPDGSVCWIHNEAEIIRDEEGNPLRVFGTAQDVTDRKQVEAALQESADIVHASEDLLRQVIDTAPNCIFAKDLDGRYVLVNRAIAELYGTTPEMMVGKTDLDFAEMLRLGVEEAEQFAADDREVIVRKKAKFVTEEPFTLPDGTMRWFQTVKVPLVLRGAPDCMLGVAINVTERKRAEEALRKERDLVALLMETSPIGITMVNREGEITFANTRAEQVLGLTKEVVTQRIYNAPEWCITDYDGGPFPDEQLPFRQVMHTGQPIYDVRHAIERPAGRRVLLSINGVPLFDSSGQIEGGVFTVEDVTEQVKAENALQEERDRAQRYLDIAGVVFVAINVNGEITLMNQKGRELFGYEQEEIIGKNWFDSFLPARLRDEVRSVFQGLMDGEIGAVEYYENPVLTKSNEERIIAWHNTILRDGGGNIIGTLSSGEDITERKRVEVALRESEDRYRDLVERSHDLVCTHDLEGRILFVNPRAADLLGYDQSTLLEMNIRDILAPEVRGEFDTYLATVQEHGVSSGFMQVQTSAGERRIWEYDNILRVEGIAEPIVRGMAHDVTERVWAERALRESEERYRGLFEGIPVGLYQTTPEGQILDANPAMVEMLGYLDLASLIAVDAASIYVDPAARRREQVLLEQEGVVRDVELRLRCYDGSIIWVRDTARAVRDTEGGVLYYEGSLEDITDRKRAAEALQQYAERLRALRAIDGAILAAWSPEEIAQAALRHIRQLLPCQGAGILTFDFEAQEVILFAMHVEGDVGLEAGMHLPLTEGVEIESLRQGGVLVEGDLESRGQDTQLSPVARAMQAVGVRAYIAAPLITRGELIGVLALASDNANAFAPGDADIVREVADQLAVALHQARLRSALEAEERRLEALVKYLPEGVLLLDDERRILVCNRVAEAYLPVLTGAAIGDVVTHLGERPVEKLLQPPAEELWHEVEIAEPSYQVFEVVAQPMAAESGVGGWVVLIRDVTVERDVQEQVQRQEQLAAVGQLAGGIAHDFNNLLTTIMLYAQMPLGKHDLPPDVTRALETILDESRGAAKLVQQILDFSRRSPIETQPVDLQPFVEEAMRVLERTIPENIRMRLEVEAGTYVVQADPTRIQQVLMNLVVNARDAMPEGGELCIELSRAVAGLEGKEGGEWVCIAVSDTGTGIAPEVLPHVFEPFFTTKGPGEGAGLGLAQVYGIVGQHGGHIGVETQVGEGTTFRVYLPAQRSEGVAEAGVGELGAAPRGRGETILLVEDERRIREVGQRVLESLGYRVLTAENGREALGVYEAAGDVDLVITDMVMPEMGGRELVGELRRADPDLKVLAITGYVVEGDPRELEAEGFLDVVHKPFDVGTLAEVVRRILDVE